MFLFNSLIAFALIAGPEDTKIHAVLGIIVVFLIGIAIGYFFRNSIGRDLSQFQIASIVKHLQNYAESETTAVRTEVTLLTTDLKKLL